jgi:hypothetical protein
MLDKLRNLYANASDSSKINLLINDLGIISSLDCESKKAYIADL